MERLAESGGGNNQVRIPTITNPRGTDFSKAERIGQAEWMLELESRAINAFVKLGMTMTDTCINYQTMMAATRGEHVAFGDTGKTSWCVAYYRWLGALNFGAGAAQTAFTEYWQAVTTADDRVDRLTKALQTSISGWRFEPVVGALQALRGVAAITAIDLVAEIGDLGRFVHPRKLMGYLGLTPSEHSSGKCTSRGSIAKTGNAHARRLLAEAAWNYRFKARICKQAQIRQQELPEPIRRMAWTAQLRLTQRFAALNARGLQANKACVAVARELTGFVWAIGMQAQREKVESS